MNKKLKLTNSSLPHSTFHTLNSNGGQLLVEALVSISIIIFGLVGILTLISTSLSYNKIVSDQYVAVYLASEGIEVMRSLFDNNLNANNITPGSVPWNKNLTHCRLTPGKECTGSEGCAVNFDDAEIKFPQDVNLPDGKNNPKNNPIGFDSEHYTYHDSSGHYNASISKTPFSRNVCVNPDLSDPGNILDVQSVVTWTGRGGASFKVSLSDRFYHSL